MARPAHAHRVTGRTIAAAWCAVAALCCGDVRRDDESKEDAQPAEMLGFECRCSCEYPCQDLINEHYKHAEQVECTGRVESPSTFEGSLGESYDVTWKQEHCCSVACPQDASAPPGGAYCLPLDRVAGSCTVAMVPDS